MNKYLAATILSLLAASIATPTLADECNVYLEEHRKLMETRAKEKGATLPAMRPSTYACDNMKARGFLK